MPTLRLLLGGTGGALLLLAAAMVRRTRSWIRECVETEGAIVRYRDDLDESGYRYGIVAYRDARGRGFEVHGPSGHHPPPIGTPLRVSYHPADPANAWVSGNGGPWIVPAVVAVVGAALALTAILGFDR